MDRDCRLNLAVTKSVKDRIIALQKELGVCTMTEVVRQAIGALEFVVNEQKQGNRILIHRKGESPREIHFNL